MPYTISEQLCKKCKESNKLFRNKWHKINKKYYLQSTCRDCEFKETKKHQESNREYWRGLNRKSYSNLKGYKKDQALASRAIRRTKLKRVHWEEELTNFVTSEANELRRLRNEYTNIKWHVDHTIPIQGKEICGLHVWNNLQVITAFENLSKHNKLVEEN